MTTSSRPTPPAWQACRRRAHQYLLDLKNPEIATYPYFFVWNDFAWEDLGPEYVAIKWHRHPDEPEYHYGDPRCREFLQVVRERQLPTLLEESLENTRFLLDSLAPDLPVIIPHLGGLSGGYVALDRAGVWRRPQVYADTAATSHRMESVSREDAAKYRELKARGKSHDEIMAILTTDP